jgi:oligosaccharide repeat unit polymerase
MALVLIVVLTIANAMTALYCIKHYASRSTILQLFFVVVWTMHYVVGNVLVLVSTNLTYTLSSFEKFEWSYLIALAIGQYFLWAYLFLLDLTNDKNPDYVHLRADSQAIVMTALGISLVFAAWFIVNIGAGSYFSQELAQYRARLGDYAGEGIGVYYYLASLLLPATILVGAYAIGHPKPRNIALFLAALVIAFVVFAPLGGRGRVVNIILVLVLTYMVLRGRFRLASLANPRLVILVVTLVAASYLWGALREGFYGQSITDPVRVAHSLSIDTTRLPFQAFILNVYDAGGTYFGVHYVEALLGPFFESTGLDGVGLLTDLSARWYYETIFGYNIRSAISPSMIGEIFINFGVIGVLFAPVLLLLLVRGAMLIGGKRSALSLAATIYFVQFSMFHGGLYALFDMLTIVLPILLFARFFSERPEPRPGGRWPVTQAAVTAP